MTVATVSVKANTPAYLTAVNHLATNPLNTHTKIIDPGSPNTSITIVDRQALSHRQSHAGARIGDAGPDRRYRAAHGRPRPERHLRLTSHRG